MHNDVYKFEQSGLDYQTHLPEIELYQELYQDIGRRPRSRTEAAQQAGAFWLFG